MATTEQAIRVSAKGEFSGLHRGLKDLQGDLKNVLGEIDKGARKGGIFDDSNLRALDTFKKRYKEALGELDKQLEKQNETVDKLYDKMHKANMVERLDIEKQIKNREKELDVIRKQIIEVEKLYKRRLDESNAYQMKIPGAGGSKASEATQASSAMGAITGALSKLTGTVGTVAKLGAGLAGIGSMLSMVQESYQIAYQRQVGSLDLAQRIRGYGFSGTGSNIYKQVASIGRRDRMGYSEAESWALQNAYTAQGGALNPTQQYGLQKFARGYGLDATTTGGIFGTVKQLGGTVQPKQFADMIAGSVSTSGMVPRILEVMQAHTGLLQNINTSFKDGSSSQILAYQTTLDRIGNANGMTKLTGQQGAGIISGLNGVFQPNNATWQWIGLSALQNHDPKKYGNMGLYDLQMNFEDGLSNPDNLPAMAKQLKKMSGGNNTVFKMYMQKWLQDGGFNATKRQVNELDKVTNGFTAFDKGKIDQVMGDSGAKYDAERRNDPGQDFQDIEARFEASIGNLGEQYILPAVKDLKGDFTKLIEAIDGGKGLPGIIDLLKDISPTVKAILVAVGIGAGVNLVSGGVNLFKKFKGAKGAKGAGGAGGAGGSGTGGAGGVADDIAEAVDDVKIGGYAVEGKLEDGVLSRLKELSGGDKEFQGTLEHLYRTTGDMDAVEHALSGKASSGDIIDMLSGGDMKVAETLRKEFEATGDIGKVFLKSEQLIKGVPKSGLGKFFQGVKGGAGKLLKGAGKGLGKVGKVLGKVPLLGGLIDFGINMLGGDSVGRAGTRAVGSSLGGWGGATAGAGIGTAIFPGVGTLIGGLIGGVAGGLGGDAIGSGIFDWFKGGSGSKASKASEELYTFAQKGELDISKLNSEGLNKLQEMKDKGVIYLRDMNGNVIDDVSELKDTGIARISGLTKDGAEQLLKLQEDGNASLTDMNGTAYDALDGMRKDTSDKMDDIKKEHTGVLGSIGNFFATIGDWFFKKLGIDTSGIDPDAPDTVSGADPGTGRSGSRRGSDVRTMSNITAYGLNQKLGGKLAGHGLDFIEAGQKYGIDPAFLASIAMAETGNGAHVSKNNVGGLMGSNGLQSFKTLADGINAMAKLVHSYTEKGRITPEDIQKHWAPVGASNDPNNLNSNWLKNVTAFWEQLAGMGYSNVFSGGANVGDSNIGGNFFDGWQSRVTSKFGALRAGGRRHGGLDINGEQGDVLQALAGGKVSFLHMDDGSKYDSDGRKNTRAGGTELGIKMPDGRTYFYSHLSNVNPNILKRWASGDRDISIDAGDWLGNLGGDVGKPGSGYSTTGSHLHLGYLNSKGVRIDPVGLLNSLDVGDSDIGTSGFGGYSETKITVDVNIKGEGASHLNNATVSELKKLIKQTVTTMRKQTLSMNTATRG